MSDTRTFAFSWAWTNRVETSLANSEKPYQAFDTFGSSAQQPAPLLWMFPNTIQPRKNVKNWKSQFNTGAREFLLLTSLDTYRNKDNREDKRNLWKPFYHQKQNHMEVGPGRGNAVKDSLLISTKPVTENLTRHFGRKPFLQSSLLINNEAH